MFSQKFGGFLNVCLLVEKDQDISRSGSSISVTGNGAGIVKIGLGVKYIPFTKDRWSLYTDLAGGYLRAKADGGSGSVSISNGGLNLSLIHI